MPLIVYQLSSTVPEGICGLTDCALTDLSVLTVIGARTLGARSHAGGIWFVLSSSGVGDGRDVRRSGLLAGASPLAVRKQYNREA